MPGYKALRMLNIGSENGLLPDVNKPFPKPMLTKITDAVLYHQGSIS